MQAADRVRLLFRRRRRLDREHGEEEGVPDRGEGLLDNLLWLTGNRCLLRDVDFTLSDRSCEALNYSGSPWLVGGKEKSGSGDNAAPGSGRYE